jgi:hypothetical protein
MTYEEAEREWWGTRCSSPPADEFGRSVYFGVRCPLPPTRRQRECSVPVRPGFGQAAFKAGCEDEWIDRMDSRYGGNW